MRGLTKRWIGPAGGAGGGEDRGHGSLLDRVLRARGIGADDAGAFLNPRLTDLHDPSLIPDLDRAAERLLAAARGGETIAVYGDYDVDGVTASAILARVLRAVEPGARLETYIPHRLEEGYGLNGDALRELRARGASVVVTVDCGVTARAEARVAREVGLDLIVTDHHNPPERVDDLPEAHSVVHPGRPDSAYPFEHLCGAAVAFKLAWRVCTLAAGGERVPDGWRALLLDMLALASLGTIADVVPLVGENRAIARFGLARVRPADIVGLRALISVSGLDGEDVDAEAVGFRLGPRLNACGRMGHAREALELLTTDDAARAEMIAERLHALNDKRQSTERAILEEACAMAEAAGMTGDARRAIVLESEGWHAGVIGIVCSRLVERYGRPAVLLQRTGATCQGSCRSVDGFNIHGALTACAEHLERFGGHDMAAGLTLRADRFEAFAEALVERANAALAVEDLAPGARWDAEAGLEELTLDAVRSLAGLAPFGRSNPKPTLLLRGLRVARAAQPLGARGRHLALHAGGAGGAMRMVAWNWGERRSFFGEGRVFDALVRPKANAWRGRTTVEGEIVDVREAETPAARARALSRPSSVPS